MKQTLRKTAVALSLLAAAAAGAQSYPTKPVRLIVPFPAGGGTDLTARTIAQRLTESLGQTIIVDNRAGAGGTIGADLVAKAAPDGYTLLMGTPGPMTINPVFQTRMPYDSVKDFAPISLATISPFVLVAHPSLPVQSVKQLIALAKAKPNALNYGSAGNGSVSHLSAEQFKALANVVIAHVPYKGSTPAMTDLIGGQLQLMFENQPVVLPQIRSGKVRGLAVGTTKRSALLPELPTMVEAGVPGYESSTAFGVLAPARTPRELVDRLSTEIARILHSQEIRERLSAQGLEPVGSTPEQYAAQIRDELAKNARIVKLSGIKAD